ncbi:MAG TPA: FG-GAP-like repeat-containing protein [Candidatus Sulfotelmatobacter sp.]|nr:FG-GAP-like repeat-containing protein [Candidatus Sulfotelmatobacter sp.]
MPSRREFLISFSQGTASTLIPNQLWRLLSSTPLAFQTEPSSKPHFQFHPQYRTERPLESTLARVRTGFDEFLNEKYADEIGEILAGWRTALLRSCDSQFIEPFVAENFSGVSPQPISSRLIRSDNLLEIRRNDFGHSLLDRAGFLRDLNSSLSSFDNLITADFQITRIDSTAPASPSQELHTVVHYELAGTAPGVHRIQRVGDWTMDWERAPGGALHLRAWQITDETQASAHSPIYLDIASAALGGNPSFSAQLMHGSDYWRTVIDGASGIDIYGHNGLSIADVDGDGYDDLYICQPAGLPNRLYRNRGDGTFEDVTEVSGLGILENTACALFADFSNRGHQDAIIVRNNGPLLYINDGGGRYRLKENAFQFATPPQGTFTSAAAADYDRDGWLDVYFCLYSYYQGTGQYKYPSPYHDAENGPPNFLMRNNRDGTFRDVTAESGLNQGNTRYSFACAWDDYNHDGWPDLAVVNDFGRKNLYHNNCDGTFKDVAGEMGVEDIGAGMSASWFDDENDGAPDLYVANMWTAAGLRVSMQDNFKPNSTQEIRSLYQKHAMGNSLFRNAGKTFQDATSAAGVGLGRWSWASDAFDFDHDGYLDLYVTNGMVSGPSRRDLNSFFWRQVVSKSPDDASSGKEYENGWQAINELIRSDETWSGYERNVVYSNNRDGTFSDVSAVVGLDFLEDGRSFALADFDRDGRQELVLKNRNAPQIRLLKNAAKSLPPSIAFRLQGTKSNRDAIGATVTIRTRAGLLTRPIQAGSGFLSQHSKELFFGLGDTSGPVDASIRWPSGLLQEFKNLPLNRRIWLVEGSNDFRSEPFAATAQISATPSNASPEADTLPINVETWLLAPIAAPDFSLPDSNGKTVRLSAFFEKTVLLSFWNEMSFNAPGIGKTFLEHSGNWAKQGLQSIVISVNHEPPHRNGVQNHQFLLLAATDEVAAVYNIIYRQIYDRHRDLTLPVSFLINTQSEIVKVYQGPLDPGHVEEDFQNIPKTDSERLARALPFPIGRQTLAVGRNYLSLGAQFFQRGYLEEAESAFHQASREDPQSAEAVYGVGSVLLNQNKNPEAQETFERAIKLQASYPDTIPDSWNNLGVIATREGRIDDSISCFKQALRINPRHQAGLDNLGNAYRLQKQWNEAREVLQRATELSPDDPDANYGLGMVFAQTGENDKALDRLQKALHSRPDYPEALNNLGVLYLVMQRRNDAVAAFQKCIEVAPAFDQAYINLARVFALEGTRDQARKVLLGLLKQHPDHPQAIQMLDQLQE